MPASGQAPLLALRRGPPATASIQILHGVSLHVDAGEVVAVIGPNGAGKSTTFKVIMGLITHLGGEIAFDRAGAWSASARTASSPSGSPTCPRDASSSAQMTVRENLEMGAYLERDKAQDRGGHGLRLRAVPPPRRAAAPARRLDERRRAADARHGTRRS